LQSWAAREWRRHYPDGEAKVLPPAADRPFAGGVLRPETVTAFLSGTLNPGPGPLATLVCPERWHSAERARELLGQALHGVLLAQQEVLAGPRSRLYLLAEPGLTALLLYAAALLLPGEVVDDLTFSTYENAHRSLRHFKWAQVLGTFAQNADK